MIDEFLFVAGENCIMVGREFRTDDVEQRDSGRPWHGTELELNAFLPVEEVIHAEFPGSFDEFVIRIIAKIAFKDTISPDVQLFVVEESGGGWLSTAVQILEEENRGGKGDNDVDPKIASTAVDWQRDGWLEGVQHFTLRFPKKTKLGRGVDALADQDQSLLDGASADLEDRINFRASREDDGSIGISGSEVVDEPCRCRSRVRDDEVGGRGSWSHDGVNAGVIALVETVWENRIEQNGEAI